MLLSLSAFVLLFAFWLLLSGHFTPFLIAAGVGSAIAVVLFGRRMEVADRDFLLAVAFKGDRQVRMGCLQGDPSSAFADQSDADSLQALAAKRSRSRDACELHYADAWHDHR